MWAQNPTKAIYIYAYTYRYTYIDAGCLAGIGTFQAGIGTKRPFFGQMS